MKDIINFNFIQQFFQEHRLNSLKKDIIVACNKILQKSHGDIGYWQSALEEMPIISNANITVDKKGIRLTGDCTTDSCAVEEVLKKFCPWRKGPFNFLDIFINTEWNSLLKWQRIKATNIDFTNKNVLDIGCGNGVFAWFIYQNGAKSVTGIDPMWLFYYQFMVIQRYIKNPHLCFLPLRIEDFPLKNTYDIVLSMGVLYHRKSPLDHLLQLKKTIKKGGHLILETIVLCDSEKTLLTPQDRYAGMKNVWLIPSVGVLIDWITKVGFTVIYVSDLVKTTLEEQQQSEWMNFYSLNNFLDTGNDSLTIEGYPAPFRVIISAKS